MTPSWTDALVFLAFSHVKISQGQRCDENSPPFEEALKKLEGIVEAMESDDLPLETLLARYEEGTKLVKSARKSSPRRN